MNNNPMARGLTSENRARGARNAAKLRVRCPVCNMSIRPCSLRNHINAQHEARPEVLPARKRCSRCDTWKPASEFHRKRQEGRPDQLQSHCKACHRLDVKESYWRDPARGRARQRKHWSKVSQDPERLAIRRDQRRQRHGWKPRVTASTARSGPELPKGPFVEWLKTLGDTYSAMADATGLPEKTIRGIFSNHDRVSMQTVDRACTTAERGITVDDLYPMGEVIPLPRGKTGAKSCVPTESSYRAI